MSKFKNNLVIFFSTIFIFFILLNDHTFYSDYFDNISTLFLVLSFASLLVVVCLIHKMFLNPTLLIIVLVWSLCVLIPCVIAGANRMLFVRFAYWITIFIFLCLLHSGKVDYKIVLFKVFKIYCIWCLITYFYCIFNLDFLPKTLTSDKLLYNWYSVDFYGWIIYKPVVKFTIGDFSVIKLYSPFGEPGLVQMYFNFSLIYLLYFKETKTIKRRKIWIFLFAISILLSFSMIGIVIMMISFIFYFKKKKRYILLVLAAAIGIVVFTQLIYQKIGTDSFGQRSNDYLIMFDEIEKNFPFGIGLGNISSLDYSKNQINQYYESFGFYSGLLYPILQYGIFGFAYYIMLVVALCRFSKNNTTNFVFASFLLLTLLTQPQADECFILMFLFQGAISISVNKNYQIVRKSSLTNYA